MTNEQPSGFQPFAQLQARLPEFQASYGKGDAKDAQPERPEAGSAKTPDPIAANQDWLEGKFVELKELLAAQAEEKSVIASFSDKLAGIAARIDALSERMPDPEVIGALHSQLGALSQSLDDTSSQSARDADRIAAAAREILAAAADVEEARQGFEHAARYTAGTLGQTVVATASRAAVLAAEQVATALLPAAAERSGVERLEGELRALNRQSRETGERTEAALDKMHETLREYLERNRAVHNAVHAAPHKRQPGPHVPISSNTPAYTRGAKGFSSGAADLPRLDSITIRERRKPDDSLVKALEEAGERIAVQKQAREPSATEGAFSGADCRAPDFTEGSSAVREDEKGLPLGGIAIVALILLSVAAGLFYLHSARHAQPVNELSRDGAQLGVLKPTAAAAGGRVTPAALRIGQEARMPMPAWEIPAMFSSAGENHGASVPLPDRAAEDLKDLEMAARQGDKEAQFRIGTRFLSDGAFTNGGAAVAARWLDRAAGQGHLEAQFMLASLYERGAGVVKDEAKAMALYRNAAAGGHIRAMHNLAVLLSGHESPQDYREAAVWFGRAAQAGLTDSQYNLALLYERGLGVEQDLARAYLWYQAAARSGDKEATRQADRLKHALAAGDGGPQASAPQAGSPRASSSGATSSRGSSWHPALEDRAKAADLGGARG